VRRIAKYSIIRTLIKWQVYLFLIDVTGSFAQGLLFESSNLKDNILQAADVYARRGEWQNAVLQYYAFIYRFPTDSLVPVVNFRIAEVYERSGKVDLAEKTLRKVAEQDLAGLLALESRLRYADFLYRRGRNEECLRYALRQSEIPFQVVTIYNLIAMHDLEAADSLLTLLENRSGATLRLSEKYRELRQTPLRRDPKRHWGALGLSALWPGTGRLLFNEYWDGGLTMAGFGAVIGLVWYTVTEQPQLAFYASSAFLIYNLGSLYTTYQSSQRYQERLLWARYEQLLASYPLSEELHLLPVL